MNRYAVIMAGGGGTRFWPLSRQNAPKQLLNLSGNDAMINETIKRFDGIVPNESIYIVTSKSQETPLKEIISDSVPLKNIIFEPVGRNTAPCILYAAMVLQRRHGDGVMCVFPSDHYIDRISKFKTTLLKCMDLAEQIEGLITIGIQPKYAATGYGYIKYADNEDKNGVFKVDEFIEKPDFKTAEKYLQSGGYLWNSGMFIWRISLILSNFQRFLPRVYEKMELIVNGIDTLEEQVLLQTIYPQLQSISIDYGIMERSSDVYVVPGDFGWNDVGSWDALGSIFSSDNNGNIVKADHIGVDTKNCIIYGNGKLISTIGLEEMIVVNADDALLICPKNKAQEVKKIVDMLKESDRNELL